MGVRLVAVGEPAARAPPIAAVASRQPVRLVDHPAARQPAPPGSLLSVRLRMSRAIPVPRRGQVPPVALILREWLALPVVLVPGDCLALPVVLVPRASQTLPVARRECCRAIRQPFRVQSP